MLHFLSRPAAAGVVLLLVPLCFVSCTSDSSDILGKAYVAPATINLRRELTERNSTVATLKHGQEVAIIDVRRRFLKVRAPDGSEGWLDAADLLTSEEMEQIRGERRQALELPAQGAATVFEPLNIHIEPSRTSPAFARIQEGGVVQVLAHRLAPKTSGPSKPVSFIVSRPEAEQRGHRKQRHARGFALPIPAPPPPPANWIELSSERIEGEPSPADIQSEKRQEEAGKRAQEAKKPVILEDWTLVRTTKNETGWVLSRNLFLSIPDEVAQYAEGKRISSYFDLGAVNDSERGVKHDWLWTTSATIEPYDFDSWRVFLWNRRRHRYETSYRQRDIVGYFPVRVEPADPSEPGRKFDLITKDDDGKLRRRTYWFDGVRVHLTATEDATSAASTATTAPTARELHMKSTKPGWLRREWHALKEKFGAA
jgi:uncharacterized protein YgiM (DUF1202 family)